MVGLNRFVLSVIVVLSCFADVAAQRHRAESGLMDARDWSFETRRLSLRGYWTFYEDTLLTPQTIGNRRGSDHFFPALWNHTRGDGSGTGCATYSLKILIPDSLTELALEIPQLYNSYVLWVDGVEVAKAGRTAATAAETVPQWIYKTVSFPITNDTLSLVMQVANFHHHKGGIKDPLMLAAPHKINKHKTMALCVNIIEAVVLMILGISMLILYFRKKQKVILFFALLCLTWSLRTMFSNLYPVIIFFPDFNWHWLVRIEYFTLYGAVIWSVLFMHVLFEKLGSPILTYTLVGLNIFFILFTFFVPVIVFSKWMSLYLAVAAVVAIYGSVMAVRALLTDQAGIWFLIASILLGVIMFGYDIVAYNTVFSYNFIFLSAGYTTIFLLVTVSLLFRVDVLKSKHVQRNVLTYDDLFNKNKN